MRIVKLCCPVCATDIVMDIQGRNAIYCPICNNKFSTEIGGRRRYEHINTADIEVEEPSVFDTIRKYLAVVIIILLVVVGFAFWGISILYNKRLEQVAIEEEKIQVNVSAGDLKGKKYKGIVEELTEIGFTNIATIDMDDAGLFSFNADTIETISIDGEYSFSSSDYFFPEAKIIITYH